MKRNSLLLLIIPLLVSCSGQPETATESTTSTLLKPQEDKLSTWIASMQNDEGVLASLNAMPRKGGSGDESWDVCEDKGIASAMKAREYRPVIVPRGREEVAKGIEILKGIPETGSTFVAPHLEEIEKLYGRMTDVPAIERFEWQEGDAGVLASNLGKLGFNPEGRDDASEVVIGLLKSDKCRSVLPRYCDYAERQQTEASKSQREEAGLDALLTCDLTLWASELRLNYPQNDYKFDRFRKYMTDEGIVSIRKKAFIEDMSNRGVEKAFSYIAPPDPQYEMLKASRHVYLDAIEAGGWPEVKLPSKFTEAKVGKTYDFVPALRSRLKAEGYPVTDVESNEYDEALNSAVMLYRDVHQLNPKKNVDATLVKNMSVSPKDRLDTIDLTLQRYREQAIGSLGYYVKVNVPDFYVEVWKEGKRQARHRIVVGNDNLQKDPETNKVVPDPETLYPLHPNRTPLQTSKINEIIYQPYWNVPERIRVEELEPKLAENPNYYVENNYEEVNPGTKLYYVRELPNPKNSLGKVKFMFPNPHNTYLHDTPAKAVFKDPHRARSHGCMRVQNPLDLAELLLKNDGQWDEAKVKQILNADPAEQVTIELKDPVDVDVVYLNSRVDDSGVVAFLSDVYQYDAVRTGKVVLKKLPKPKDWK